VLETNNALLKFDIEGDEWFCFKDISADLLKHFRIITCELHGLNNLGNDNFLFAAWSVMNKLLDNHEVVHFHVNNCCGVSNLEGVMVPNTIEITLLRKDRSTFSPSMDEIPSSLDYPNMISRPDIQFVF
ncbi:MAG: hypothetical protein OQL19_10375, partial [Gammaproteobacteria bacterium]|nr:hypothetical protein [Gammaproteobacteria bacterium]